MTTKNGAAFISLSKSLNAITKDGNNLIPLIIISRGGEFLIHAITRDSKVLARLSDPNLSLLFGDGRWILLENDLWILMNELAEVLKDEIQFMDRKQNGWLQVYIPVSNRMLNLKLTSFRTRRMLWWRSLFDSRIKSLRTRMLSLP